jgi:Leucine-rich repeat (LRR) protein
MNVRSVFSQSCSPRLCAAALVACLLLPGVAAAQNPIADRIDGAAPRTIVGPAADRMVAEWMLRMGGSIVLEGQRKPIADLADLPTGDFRIHTLNFTGITMYAASLQDELRRLPALPHLKELYVNGRLWYDQPAPRVQATIALFNEATSLEKFVMSKPVQTYIPFNDPALKGLSSLKSLKEVRIHQTRSSGMSLAAFPLTHLDLNYAVTFNDAGMASLKGKTTLQRVYLRGTSITDAGIQHLSGLTNLVELDLSDVDLTDAGLAHLSGLTKLRRLNLQSANVTDSGVDVLKNMPELEELSLYRTKVSNAGLAKLSGLKNLRSVDLRYSRVTSSGVRELTSKLPNAEFLILESSNPEPKRAMAASAVAGRGDAAVAEWLRAVGGKVQMTNGAITAVSLNGTSITDKEFVVLTRLPQLKDLSLQHTEISTIGLEQLAAVRSLERLDLGHTLLGDNALPMLASLTNLRVLELPSTLIDGTGLAALTALPNLREIDLGNAPIANEGMAQLAQLIGLESLNLRHTDITDAGMVHFAALKKLKRLDITSLDITEKGLESLSSLTGLEDLDLSFTRFAEPGLEMITKLTALKRLGLEQTSVTDAGMAWVAQLPRLEALNLNYTPVSDAGIALLSTNMAFSELKLDRTDLTDKSVAWLTGQKNLKYLDLYHTQVSEQGFNSVKKALPTTEINWSLDAARARRRT